MNISGCCFRSHPRERDRDRDRDTQGNTRNPAEKRGDEGKGGRGNGWEGADIKMTQNNVYACVSVVPEKRWSSCQKVRFGQAFGTFDITDGLWGLPFWGRFQRSVARWPTAIENLSSLSAVVAAEKGKTHGRDTCG